jgi:hypothetical protein
VVPPWLSLNPWKLIIPYLRNIKGFLGKSQGEDCLKIRRLNFGKQEIKAEIEFITSRASPCSSLDDLRQNQLWAEHRRIAMFQFRSPWV